MINIRLVALTWIIEPIIRGLIGRNRTPERIVLGLIALTWTLRPIIALLSARMRTIAPIIQGRGLPLLSTLPRIVPFRRIQPYLRTQLPNMQPRNIRLMKAPALSRLTMSTMRSRLTNNDGLNV
jgi:hypothetical protein